MPSAATGRSTSSTPGPSQPVVRSFSPAGDLIAGTPLAETSADMVRVGPDGPLVHAYPSEMWLPTGQGRPPLTAEEQLAGAQVARSVDGGLAVVVSASPAEARFALVRGGDVVTRLARAEHHDPGRGAAGRALRRRPRSSSSGSGTRDQAQFRVLRLAPDGLADSFAVDRAEWAETASLSRFRLHGSTLYQLRSAPPGSRSPRSRSEGRDEIATEAPDGFVPGLVAGLTLVLLAFGAPAGAYHTNFTARCNDYWANVSPDLRAPMHASTPTSSRPRATSGEAAAGTTTTSTTHRAIPRETRTPAAKGPTAPASPSRPGTSAPRRTIPGSATTRGFRTSTARTRRPTSSTAPARRTSRSPRRTRSTWTPSPRRTTSG